MIRKNIIIVVVLLITVLLMGCTITKEAITKEEFVERMENEGYAIADATNQFDEGVVKSVTLAINDKFQIEFFDMPNADSAIVSFNTNKENIQNVKGGKYVEKSKSGSNFDSYKLKTDESYYVVSRIEDTFIYAVVPEDEKDNLDKVLTLLEYN